jgi:hypothetical protein
MLNNIHLIIILIIIILIYFCLVNKHINESWKNYKKKLCKTCKPFSIKKNYIQYFTKNNKTVPLWLKRESHYTQLPYPLLNNKRFNLTNKQNLREYVPCDNKCLSFVFDLTQIKELKNNKYLWVYYWSTLKRDYNNFIIPDAKTAFGDYSNSGLRKSDKNGIIKFKLRNPQPYQINGIIYPPHLHFCFKSNKNIWSDNIYTIFFFPQLNYEKFNFIRNKNLAIVINALPLDKGSLDNVLKIPFDNLDKIDIKKKIKVELKNYKYNKINRLLKSKRIKLKEIPLVIFCKNKYCKASIILFNHLLNIGFYNLMKYPGGIDDYNNKMGSSN